MHQIKLLVISFLFRLRFEYVYVFIEPIQSRCAMLRYSKLSDEQLLKRLMEIAKAEQVSYTSEGLEAIIFTAQGDMRQVKILQILFQRKIKKQNLGY